MTADRDPTKAFERFLAAYPERDGGHDVDAAREASEAALRRADPAAIISGAMAYARAREGQPTRYTVSARRWLSESRWRAAGSVSGHSGAALVWTEYGSKEWAAWAAFYSATKGKSPPMDSRGGWRFRGCRRFRRPSSESRGQQMSYEFQSTLFRTSGDMCRAIAFTWLSADGLNSRRDMIGFLAEFDGRGARRRGNYPLGARLTGVQSRIRRRGDTDLDAGARRRQKRCCRGLSLAARELRPGIPTTRRCSMTYDRAGQCLSTAWQAAKIRRGMALPGI